MFSSITTFWQRDFPIRTRVVALIAVILLPLLGLAGWLVSQYADAERRIIEARRFDVVNNLNFLLDGRIAQVEAALSSLAVAPELMAGDFTVFHTHAAAVANANGIASMALFEPSGQQLAATAIPLGQPLLKRDDMTPIAPAFSGNVFVSDIYASLTTNRPHVAVSVPVMRDGKVAYVLTGALDAKDLIAFFTTAGLASQWIAAIVDRKGRFITRSRAQDRYVGEPARPELFTAATGTADSGVFDNVTLDGISVANSFRRSKLSGWTTVVAVPAVELAAPLRRTMTLFLAVASLVTALSLSAAYAMAAKISSPVRKLAVASTALLQGRPLPDLSTQITELREVKTAFEHSSAKLAHLAAIVASSGDAIVSVGRDRRVITWNAGAERLFGFTADEIIGQPKSLFVPNDLIPEAADCCNRVAKGERIRLETQRQRKDGTLVDVALDLAPIGDRDGHIVAMSLIARDITKRREAEERQKFFLAELSHRSKNLLTVINSMSRQTARSAGTIEEFQELFNNRIQGLAASHDLLVAQDWAAASLGELVLRHVEVFMENAATRLNREGPEIHVGVAAAQSIGLALHELATNSIKYGALSVETGRVDVSWALGEADNGTRVVTMSWRERGGPPVTPPKRKGFGHFVTQTMIAQSLTGTVTMDYAASGVVWTLQFPATQLVTRSASPTPSKAAAQAA